MIRYIGIYVLTGRVCVTISKSSLQGEQGPPGPPGIPGTVGLQVRDPSYRLYSSHNAHFH